MSPDQVSAQLDRILSSPGFANADRASRFLRYVVERTIAGQGDQLKEFVIGQAVFDRADDYDPRIDSIVRVEAGRLRSKIEEYYSGPGRADSVLIQLRKGGYAPAFELRSNPAGPVPESRRKSTVGVIAIACVAILLTLAAWRWGLWTAAEESRPAETIAVLPFSNYSTDPAEGLLAARVTDGLTAELARLGTLGVVSHTSALQYADVRPRTSLREIAKTLNAQFVLEGKVREESGHVTIQVVLVDASLDRKIWVHDSDGALSDISSMQRQLAQATSTAIAQRKR